MFRRLISITLIISMLMSIISSLEGYKAYAATAGNMTNSSTVVDFDALQSQANDQTDTDHDGVLDEVEKILGTAVEVADSDQDGIDDYFELSNGLDPLRADTNDDGLDDLYEITEGKDIEYDVTLDSDRDGIPNISDEDNDNDGVIDHIDISPFSQTSAEDKHSIEILTNGDPTFVTIQLSPEDVEDMITYGRAMTWGEDNEGQIRNFDGSFDDLNITPYIKIKYANKNSYPDKDECIKYGYILQDEYMLLPLQKLESDGEYVCMQATIYLPKNAGENQYKNGKRLVSMNLKLAWIMTMKNDYLNQDISAKAPIMYEGEEVKLSDLDESREKEFINTSIGDLNGNDIPDFAVFYMYYDDTEDCYSYITYDTYYDIEYYSNDNEFRAQSADKNQKFGIHNSFDYVNKESAGNKLYSYGGRYDIQIQDGEICAIYYTGQNTAVVTTAGGYGSDEQNITIENGSTDYDIEKDYELHSNIRDTAGIYDKENDTLWYLYNAPSDYVSAGRDHETFLVKKTGNEDAEKIYIDYCHDHFYEYSATNDKFINSDMTNSIDIYDVNSDGKLDLVLLMTDFDLYNDDSQLYFISDVYNCEFTDLAVYYDKTILREIPPVFDSENIYARSLDLFDMNDDGIMDMSVVEAKKELVPIKKNVNVMGRSIEVFTGHYTMELTFDINLSNAIISRDDYIFTDTKPFKITGLQVETQEEVKARIFTHNSNEVMLGMTNAMEYIYINTSEELDDASYESINNVLQVSSMDFPLSKNYDFYDEAIMDIGDFFNSSSYVEDDKTQAFLVALQKKSRFLNLDDLPSSKLDFNVSREELVTNKEMSLKWTIDGVVASPEDITNMVDDNNENIDYFEKYNYEAKEDLSRYNLGISRITQIGESKLELNDSEYEKNGDNPIYLGLKVPASGAAGYKFMAVHTFIYEPVKFHGFFTSKADKLMASKFTTYSKIGKASTGVGFVIDIAFAIYSGYLYGEMLEDMGASDGVTDGARVTYAALYAAKAILMTACISAGPVGWVIFGLLIADMLADMFIDSYDSLVDEWLEGIVHALFSIEYYEGTYLSTFEMQDKSITNSNDRYFIMLDSKIEEDTTYKTIISASEEDSPANKKSILDNCWVQIYDDLYSKDAIINSNIGDNKEWSEEFYKYHDRWRQRRYFYFTNSMDFNEVGRNVLVENPVSLRYKIVEYVTVETKYGFEQDPEYNYKTIAENLGKVEKYYDVIPLSLDVFFELFDFINGDKVSSIDEIAVRDFDGDGLIKNPDGAGEIDKDGNVYSLADPEKFDTDGDGLSDYIEAKLGSNINNIDTDGDGLTDYEENKLGTDMNNIDTDGDGLSDYEEVNNPVTFTLYGSIEAKGYSNPLLRDTDGDGVADYDEHQNGTNPASKYTYGQELYDNNDHVPEVTTEFDEYYALTDGEELNINLYNHITDMDDDNLEFMTVYGSVYDDGNFSYIYDKEADGTSFEVEVTANDFRGGMLTTYFTICEDKDNPFLTSVIANNRESESINRITEPQEKDSSFEIVFNEEIVIADSSLITVEAAVYNEDLDVDSNGDRLSNEAIVTTASAKSIYVERAEGIVENNVGYEIVIDKNAITDTNGNILQDDCCVRFDTVDTIAPKIVSVTIDPDLTIEFNEPIYQEKGIYYGGYGSSEGVRIEENSSFGNSKTFFGDVVDGNKYVAAIKPNTLKSYTEYILSENEYKFLDLADNRFPGCSGLDDSLIAFTTSDVTGPSCTLQEIEINSIFVTLSSKAYSTVIENGEIRITFDEAIQEGKDFSSIALSHESNLYFYGCTTAAAIVKESAAKAVLPYEARIEDNILIITPDNYNDHMNYSVFIGEDAINDMNGNCIPHMYDGKYYVRILAKSPNAEISVVDADNTNILGLVTSDDSMERGAIVAPGINENSSPASLITVVLNQQVTMDGTFSDIERNARLLSALEISDSQGNSKSYTPLLTTLTANDGTKYLNGFIIQITEELASGETYTITINPDTFRNLNDPIGTSNEKITFAFNVENDVDLGITNDDVYGEVKVGETISLEGRYLGEVLGTFTLNYQWYKSDTDDFTDAAEIAGATKSEYTIRQEDEGKYLFVKTYFNEPYYMEGISNAIGPVEETYQAYCDIDNISVLFEEIELLTSFDVSTYQYDITVSAEKDEVLVNAEFDESKNMRVTINGFNEVLWQEDEGLFVPVDFGNNLIEVVSLAENGVDKKVYTINIFRDKNDSPENVKPVAKKVSIDNSSDIFVGDTLVGSYTYSDDLNRAEEGTVFKWYRDNETEELEEIQGANNASYTITSEDIGYGIIFSVTPRTQTEIAGKEYFSNWTALVETADNNLYAVTFEENGGSEVADITGLARNSLISEPTEPIRTGYIFDGWYKDIVLKMAWDFSSDTVTENTTLYAKWRVKSSDSSGTKIPTKSNKIPEELKGENEEIVIKDRNVEITFNGESFENLKNRDVEFVVKEVNKEDLNLTDKQLEQIGKMPIFDLGVLVDGNKLHFESDEPIKIAIEIDTAKNIEKHKLVAVYYDENNTVHILHGIYDGKVMHFETNHFSFYGMMYINKSFEDSDTHWAQEAIEALASRGVINGTSETTFAPNNNITRADFITLVVRYFGLEGNKNDNFDDVNSNMYYTDSIAIAKDLEIINGCGKNMFKPLENISRQDMMVILARALKVSGKYDKLDIGSKTYTDYYDSYKVADYAVESVDYLISTGLINGTNARVYPNASTTRAEVAQLLYNLLIELYH